MSTLDQFKEEWKKQNTENFSSNINTQTAMLTLLNSKTKENVRKKTAGLLGITFATCAMIQGVGAIQDKINDPWVDALCWLTVPSLMILCVTASILYFLLNRHKLSKMNTVEYLKYLVTQLRRTELLVKRIVFPLVPITFVPAILFVIQIFHLKAEQIQVIVTGYYVFLGIWLVFGFAFFFRWLMNKHDYQTLRKEVEISLSDL